MRGCITCDLYLLITYLELHLFFISARASSEWQIPTLEMEEPFQHPKQNRTVILGRQARGENREEQ